MANELVIVGASVRAAAHSALRAGFRAYAIDQFADRDLTSVCRAVKVRRFPHDLWRALMETPHVPWIYTGGLENFPRLVDRMAALRPLWGNAGSVLRPVRDPWQLAEVVREAGLELPAMARELGRQQKNEHWLVKPLRSSGGHRIEVASDSPFPPRPGSYYQLLVPGQSYGAVYLAANDGCALLGVSQQIRSAGTFGYQGSIVLPGPWHRRADSLTLLGQTLTDRFKLRGLFNVDFVESDVGIWPLEVNPRYSASVEVLERATGLHFLALHAAVFDETLKSPKCDAPIPPPTRAVGKAIVYSQSSGHITAGIERLQAEWNDGSSWPGIADVPRVGDLILAGQPICTVLAESDSLADVQRQLAERSQRVLESAISTTQPS
jgi:uncharacterized protein